MVGICIHVHIYMYVCMYVRTYLCMYVCECVCIATIYHKYIDVSTINIDIIAGLLPSRFMANISTKFMGLNL